MGKGNQNQGDVVPRVWKVEHHVSGREISGKENALETSPPVEAMRMNLVLGEGAARKIRIDKAERGTCPHTRADLPRSRDRKANGLRDFPGFGTWTPRMSHQGAQEVSKAARRSKRNQA